MAVVEEHYIISSCSRIQQTGHGCIHAVIIVTVINACCNIVILIPFINCNGSLATHAVGSLTLIFFASATIT